MTPESRDVIILATWSKFYFSKMWHQQSYDLYGLQAFRNLTKMLHFTKNTDVIAKMIARNKF